MFGIDAEKLRSDVNVAWIGVITVELLVVFLNLYIQYCMSTDIAWKTRTERENRKELLDNDDNYNNKSIVECRN